MKIIEYIKSIISWKKTIACIVKNENYYSANKVRNSVETTIKNALKDQSKSANYHYRENKLTNFTLHSKESGVTGDAICSEEVIVSLTTYGPRFYEAFLAIESIMQGTIKPNRIILWLGEELRDEPVPITLQNQMKRGLEIRYVKDILSYKKLIYALKEFPDATIITIDDDIMYECDTVENLINAHKRKPYHICSNILKAIPDDITVSISPLNKWHASTSYLMECDEFIAYGAGGILYPPHSLHKEVFNEDAFMSICNTADDIWFSSMAMLNKTKAVYSYPHIGNYIPVENKDVQSIALRIVNDHGEVLNVTQLKNVLSKYNLCGFSNH